MFSIKGKMTAFFLLVLIATPFVASCTIMFDIDGDFKNLFERNVVWSDEEGKITITVQGERSDCGFARLLLDGKERRATANFVSNNQLVGIAFESEESMTGVYKGYSLVFRFNKANGDSSAIFSSSGANDYSSEEPLTNIKLTKRPIAPEELDARYCVRNYWCTEDRKLFLYQLNETPYTGKMSGTYKDNRIDFLFTDDHGFKIDTGEEPLGEGKYVSTFEGMTLLFDAYGKEEFGESLSLVWCWANAQIASLSSN